MKKTLQRVLFGLLGLALTASLVFTACSSDAKSNEKDITAFSISVLVGGEQHGYVGEFSAWEDNVILVPGVPDGANLSKVRTTIAISEYATVSPGSGDLVDFSGGDVKFVVTAQDETTKDYSVRVSSYTATLKVQLVSNGNGNINVYGINGTPVAGYEANANLGQGYTKGGNPDVDFTISTRVYDNADKLYNPSLPNTLLISLGAVIGNGKNFADSDGVYTSIQWFIDGVEYDGTQTLPYTYGYLRNGGTGATYNTGDGTTGSNAGQYIGSATGSGPDSADDWTDKNIVSIDARHYAYTIPHYITIVATKDGIDHSKTITFRVVR